MRTNPTLLCALALALVAGAGAARAAVFVANVGYDALDADGAAPCDVDPDAPDIDYQPNNPTNDLARPCSLRAAIVLANLTPEGDSIAIDFNPDRDNTVSTFELSLKGAGEDAGLTGDLDITTPISILGEGTAGNFDITQIDGKRLKDRIFDVHPGGSLELRRTSVLNGKAGKDADPSGGCIRSAGPLSFGSVFFYRCSAPGDGGCVGLLAGGSLSAGDTIFSTCKAKGEGGGLALRAGTATFTSGTFGRNRAAVGGAIASRGDLTLRNVTADANGAKLGGGLALLGAGATTVGNCTITENGGVNLDASQNTGALSVTNTIVWGAKTDCVGTVPTGGGNLEGGTSCGFTGTNDQQSQDPLLAPIDDYGGLVPTRPPTRFVNDAGDTITSPAIDHGVDTLEACDLDARKQVRGPVLPMPVAATDSGATDYLGGSAGSAEITSTPVTTATVGVPYSYDVEATNAERPGCIRYFLTGIPPPGMSIDSATGLISWTPAAGQEGNPSVQVRASDPGGGAADTQSFTIAVAPAP